MCFVFCLSLVLWFYRRVIFHIYKRKTLYRRKYRQSCFHLPEAGAAVQFIINLEIQLNDTPGYPIVTRGFYYCSRMISGQYGTVFTGEHYEKLQKVYSIWICSDPAKKRRNGIFRYYTKEEAVLGSSGVDQTAYDLMEVVVLNLGDAEENSQQEVLNLLNILFSVNVTPVEKKRRLQEAFSIAMTREFEGEVENMCNLSQGLVEYGIERGIERGMKRGIEKGELKKAREAFYFLFPCRQRLPCKLYCGGSAEDRREGC